MVIGTVLGRPGDLMYACIHGNAAALLNEALTSLRSVHISS